MNLIVTSGGNHDPLILAFALDARKSRHVRLPRLCSPHYLCKWLPVASRKVYKGSALGVERTSLITEINSSTEVLLSITNHTLSLITYPFRK